MRLLEAWRQYDHSHLLEDLNCVSDSVDFFDIHVSLEVCGVSDLPVAQKRHVCARVSAAHRCRIRFDR